MKQTYTQCRISRPTEGGVQLDMVWIPSKFAVQGKTIIVRSPETGEWTDLWEVREVWGTRSAEEADARSHDHTRTRKASDV